MNYAQQNIECVPQQQKASQVLLEHLEKEIQRQKELIYSIRGKVEAIKYRPMEKDNATCPANVDSKDLMSNLQEKCNMLYYNNNELASILDLLNEVI